MAITVQCSQSNFTKAPEEHVHANLDKSTTSIKNIFDCNVAEPVSDTSSLTQKEMPLAGNDKQIAYPPITGSEEFKANVTKAIDEIYASNAVSDEVKAKLLSLDIIEDANMSKKKGGEYHIKDKNIHVNSTLTLPEIADTLIHETTHAIQHEKSNFLWARIPTIEDEVSAYYAELKYCINERDYAKNPDFAQKNFMFSDQYDAYIEEHPNATENDIKQMLYDNLRNFDEYADLASHNNFFSINLCTLSNAFTNSCKNIP